MKKITAILGPTAIGKTSFAIKKAIEYDTEIISFDSRQFYKEMSIGTAVPSKEELQSVKHHFIHNKSIKDNYTFGDFQIEATSKIKEIFRQKDNVIMVGGSGMYLDAVIYGFDNFPKIPKEIRDKIKLDYEEKGLTYIQDLLKKKDIISFNTIDINNHQRVIRALEVCIYSNKPFSSFLSNEKKRILPYKIEMICLINDREYIYDRINKRVDIMINSGLLEEVKGLYKYKNLNALQTVGYRELFAYLEGKITLESAIELIKQNTRRYAKRQLTWIRNKYDDIEYNSIKVE